MAPPTTVFHCVQGNLMEADILCQYASYLRVCGTCTANIWYNIVLSAAAHETKITHACLKLFFLYCGGTDIYFSLI